MIETKATTQRGDKPTLSIKDSAALSPGNEIPPLPSNLALSNIPTKAQLEAEKQQQQGKKSQTSLQSSDEANSRGREINDTFVGRIMYLQWSFIALIINLLFLYFIYLLQTKEGVTIEAGGSIFEHTCPIILNLWMHLIYICTDYALSKSLASYFAYQLSQKHGYSLIVCGFIQSGLFAKIQFSGLLNFRSKYKKILSRVSILWLVHTLMLIVTFFCSTAIKLHTTRKDEGHLLCVSYDQEGEPVDRGWPTLETGAGVAEFIFGSSLGILSSEHGTENSVLVTYPQMIDKCTDGTVIVGPGFSTDIATECLCAHSNSDEDLIYAGIDEEHVKEVEEHLDHLGLGQGLVELVEYDDANKTVKIITILNGAFRSCGGINYQNKSALVCQTELSNHQTQVVSISWMNDGNKARSAPEAVAIISEQEGHTPEEANAEWLYQAMMNLYGEKIHSTRLTGFYPGTVSYFSSNNDV